MIRLTWRQFRVQALVTFGLLVVVAIVLVITRPHLVHLATGSTTNPLTGAYRILFEAMNWVVLAVPALIGVFWGAPLVAREVETGSFRLAWTQSVTRTRWLAVKLGLIGLSSVVVAGLLSLMITWWASPIDAVNMVRFDAAMFGLRGITPLGYAAFAFALGVTAGILICRTLPAMAATLAALIAARFAVTYWVRPYLAAPAHLSLDVTPTRVWIGGPDSGSLVIGANAEMPNALVRSIQVVDMAGHVPTTQVIKSIFPSLGTGGPRMRVQEFEAGIAKLAETYHVLVTYQPANRYWPFQAGETAIFFALALVLAAVCFWWVRRRLS